MTHPLPRVSDSQLRAVADGLSTRDWQILRFLVSHRFATTTQVREAFFSGHATQLASARACIRVLDRHLRDRLVGRLERRVGGVKHGSSSFIWHLDVAGNRLTHTGPGRRRLTVPSPDFLDHTLAVVDAHLVILDLARTSKVIVERVEIETEAWRPFTTAYNTASVLKPDLYAHLSTADYDDHWYIEIDRGTESLPVLLAKCRTYAAYRATGRAQAEHGVFPRALWVLPTKRRVAALTAAIRADPGLDERLFLAITADHLTATLRDPDSVQTATEGDQP